MIVYAFVLLWRFSSAFVALIGTQIVQFHFDFTYRQSLLASIKLTAQSIWFIIDPAGISLCGWHLFPDKLHSDIDFAVHWHLVTPAGHLLKLSKNGLNEDAKKESLHSQLIYLGKAIVKINWKMSFVCSTFVLLPSLPCCVITREELESLFYIFKLWTFSSIFFLYNFTIFF